MDASCLVLPGRLIVAFTWFVGLVSFASARDSAVVINEVQYHPAGEVAQSEWIELRCLHGVDVDMSGWRLAGAVDFTFPAGTVIRGRSFVVVAQNPAAMPGLGGGLLFGPWTGRLDNAGEEIRLLNNSGRLMDVLGYGDDGDWPSGADGSGATLARRDQTAAAPEPSAWTTSNELGGTPGSSNFADADSQPAITVPVPIDAEGWKYNDSNTAPPADWKNPGFADAAWPAGRGLFFRGPARLGDPVPGSTALTGPGEGLVSYWAMDDAPGSAAAANAVTGGPAATLHGSVGSTIDFVTDAAPRGKVLRVNMSDPGTNAAGSWVAAGSLSSMTLTNDFTWAFWARSNDGPTNNVVLGNRYADAGTTDFNPREFIKFTPNAFEWHVDAAGQNIDYADVPNSQWIHHAVVKQGAALTYYRNGVQAGTVTVTSAPLNPQPLFMGGNGPNESWAGHLDDVALWNKAVPEAALAALAADAFTPATLPTNVTNAEEGPFPVPPAVVFPVATTAPLSDDFGAPAVDGAQWEIIDQGLESTADSGLTVTQSGGRVTIGGTAAVGGWAGKTLRSVQSFSTRSTVTAQVRRQSLTGTGARRSSLWLWGDANHYLHFSQNIGESGWTWNAVDTGGTGTSNPTGVGNNVAALNFADSTTSAFLMKLVWVPGAYPGQGTVQIWLDNTLAASHAVTNWPSNIKVLLTGQAKLAGGAVTAVFDDAAVSVQTPDPLQTEVAAATTHYFRKTFDLPGDPAQTSLSLWPIHDDGAVYYLNGVEIHRDNIGPSPVHGALATRTVVDASFPKDPVAIPASALRPGTNVLAVQVHQGGAASPDMLFGAQIMASTLPTPRRDQPALRLSEISGAGEPAFRIELKNTSAEPLTLGSFALRTSDGQSHQLGGSLAPGGFLVLDETTLGWRPAQGTRLFLVQGAQLFDSRVVTNRLRGLAASGAWAFPSAPTFGAENNVQPDQRIVINEIMYEAPSPSPEQWIELYNRSTTEVDLSGWQFSDGISYVFPAGSPPVPPGGFALVVWDVAAFNALHPGLPRVFGPFTSNLAGKGERLRLRDTQGNVADEVRYAEGGTWPDFTNGTASSLELRHPDADNANGMAWAASNESARGTWQNVDYTFRGTNFEGAPTYYSELILGLINDGEVLIDDISVRREPAGANIELIQNGSFSAGTAEKWRFAGNTRRSVVVDDPSSPGNPVLKLVQNGSLDHMSNHAETTLKNGNTLLGANGIAANVDYRISFRARWWRGHNALRSNLYFNRGAVTTVLGRPTTGGTPGALNSTASPSATLTIGDVMHTPAVPAVSEPATVTARVHDPLDTTSLVLVYSVNGGAEQSVPMSRSGDRWSGTIPGQAKSAKANFRIDSINSLGHTAVWPPKGLAGRALVPWNDDQAQLVRPSGARPHNVRIVMTAADTTLLHAANNVMSNDWMPCTVIYDEREVYYGVGVHLKGSEHGRAKTVRAGFHLRFPSDQPFLGLHPQVAIDRSGAGDQFSQKEILVKRSMNRAGGIPSTEDDLIRVIAPQTVHTGPAIFVHNKIDSDNFLDGQFSDGGSGTLFEYELLYPLYAGQVSGSTDNNTLEGNKLTQDSPGPGGVPVRKLNPGLSKEEYRWFWLIKNNRTRDDYDGLIPALTALGQSGLNFHVQTAPLLDTDGWLRSFTGPIAWAVGDNYAFGSQHNCLYYVKPDGRTLYIPWDMDFTATDSATASVTPNAELGKMINTVTTTTADDVNKRAYYGHLLHMVNTGFNPGYLGPWMDHYSGFVNENYRALFLTFVAQRERHIRTAIETAVRPVAFQITTNGGNDLTEAGGTVTLAGDGWVNVSTISLAGGAPLAVTWTDQDSWSLQLPVASGPNVFDIEARDSLGTVVGTDRITVTGTGGVVPASSSNLIVTEVNYHPAVDGEEFIEMLNVSASRVSLAGCFFTEGLAYTFPAGTELAAGQRLILVENRALFAARYPAVGGLAPGEYTPSNLSNGGETVTLRAADGLSDVFSFPYGDGIASTDGLGRSLVRIVGCLTPDGYEWRASTADLGNPGTSDGLAFSGDPLADADLDGHCALIEYAFGTSDLVWTPETYFMRPNGSDPPILATPVPNADCARVELQTAETLGSWFTAPGLDRPQRYWRWRVSLR